MSSAQFLQQMSLQIHLKVIQITSKMLMVVPSYSAKVLGGLVVIKKSKLVRGTFKYTCKGVSTEVH